ncbi:MAG: hypothetical protein ACJAVK_001068 [Akkermansiaceae bacterium]|jgi:hypothetical protein
MNSNSTQTAVILVTGLVALVTSTGWGAKAPMSQEARMKKAEHVVSGTVVALVSKFHQSTVEKGPGLGTTRVTLGVLVDAVGKGEVIKRQTKIEVKAWRRSTKIPSLQGQDWTPKKGDRITLYLTGGDGKAYEPLLPNGMELTKAPVNPKILEFKKGTKQEVFQGMLGFRDTQVFYQVADQGVILTLSIGNKDKSFPVTAKLYHFKDSTTDKDLKKWINNQHSDGLNADAPKPVAMTELPKDSCKVTSSKLLEAKEGRPGSGVFEEYEVVISMKAVALEDGLKISAYTDKTKVYLKKK